MYKAAVGLIGVGFCIGVGIYLSRKACSGLETFIVERSPWLQDKMLGKPAPKAGSPAESLAGQSPA